MASGITPSVQASKSEARPLGAKEKSKVTGSKFNQRSFLAGAVKRKSGPEKPKGVHVISTGDSTAKDKSLYQDQGDVKKRKLDSTNSKT